MGGLSKVMCGDAQLEVQALTLLYTIFDRQIAPLFYLGSNLGKTPSYLSAKVSFRVVRKKNIKIYT